MLEGQSFSGSGSVQAIALGQRFVVLAVDRGRDDARVSAALRQVLARVGRK